MLVLCLLFCFQIQQMHASHSIQDNEDSALSSSCVVASNPLQLYEQQQYCDRLYSYIFKIKIPATIELREALCGFYKGKPIEFEKNCAVLLEDEEQFTFSLIITPEIDFKTSGNNVRYVQRIKNKPFRWYDFTLIRDHNASLLWTIKELQKKEAPLKIPDHTIILLLHPKCVERLIKPKICSNAHACPDSACVVVLPTVVLREDMQEDELHTCCAEAQIASLELRAIHQKPSAQVRKEQLAVIELCNRPS